MEKFAWKDAKKKLAMIDFDGIKEKIKCTLEDIMKNRKVGYSKTWMERFQICDQMVLK